MCSGLSTQRVRVLEIPEHGGKIETKREEKGIAHGGGTTRLCPKGLFHEINAKTLL